MSGTPHERTELDELRERLLRDPAGSIGMRPSEADLKAMGLAADWCRPADRHDVERLIAALNAHPDLTELVREALDRRADV